MFGKVAVKTYLRLKRARLRRSLFPKDITLFVTSRYNSQCEHYFYGKLPNDEDELTDEDLITVINSFPALNSLCLTGGEPMLRNNILELIGSSISKAQSVTICTNGRLEKVAKQICDTFAESKNRLSFHISIDGTEKTHDSIRGRGSYRSSINTMQMVGMKGYQVIGVLTLSKQNLKDIEEVFRNLYGIAAEMRINIVRSAHDSIWGLPKRKMNLDHTPRSKDIALSNEELRSARTRLTEVNRQYPLWSQHNRHLLDAIISMYQDKTKLFECLAGRSEAVVYQNGDLSLCEFYKPFLNIRDYGMDFKKAWRSPSRKKELLFIKNCRCVHSCNLSSGLTLSDDFVLESAESQGLYNLLRKRLSRMMS